MIQMQLLLPPKPNKPLSHPIVVYLLFFVILYTMRKEKIGEKEYAKSKYAEFFNKKIDLILKRCIIKYVEFYFVMSGETAERRQYAFSFNFGNLGV